jgi:hypothetical protein
LWFLLSLLLAVAAPGRAPLASAAKLTASSAEHFANKWVKWSQSLDESVTGEFSDNIRPENRENAEYLLNVAFGDYKAHVDEVLGVWEKEKDDLRAGWETKCDRMPKWRGDLMRSKNIDLLRKIGETLDFPDMGLFDILEFGTDSIMAMEKSGSYALEERQCRVNRVADKKFQNPKPCVFGFQSAAMLAEVWKQMMGKVEEGLAEGPYELHQLEGGARHCNLFCIEQGDKKRCVWDARAANRCSSVVERLSFPSHSDILDLVNLCELNNYAGLGGDYRPVNTRAEYEEKANALAGRPREKLDPITRRTPVPKTPRNSLFTLDFSSAFEQLVPARQTDFTAIVYDPKGNRHRAFYARYSPFGFLSSIWVWCRLSCFFTHAARALLRCVCEIYVDDLIGVAPFLIAPLMVAALERFFNMVGYKISAHKTQCGSSCKVLGVEMSISASYVRVSGIPEKVALVRLFVHELIGKSVREIDYKTVTRLCGRVGHIVACLRDIGLRRIIAPMYSLLNEDEFDLRKRELQKEGFSFDRNFRALLQGLVELKPITFVFERLCGAPARAWTDADDPSIESGEGASVGGFIQLPDGKYLYFFEMIPESLVVSLRASGMEKMIMVFEMAAQAAAAYALGLFVGECRVEAFIDNKAAFFAASHGYAHNAALSEWALNTNLLYARAGLVPSYHYIATDWNVSDGFTRHDLRAHLVERVERLGARRVRVPWAAIAPVFATVY